MDLDVRTFGVSLRSLTVFGIQGACKQIHSHAESHTFPTSYPNPPGEERGGHLRLKIPPQNHRSTPCHGRGILGRGGKTKGFLGLLSQAAATGKKSPFGMGITKECNQMHMLNRQKENTELSSGSEQSIAKRWGRYALFWPVEKSHENNLSPKKSDFFTSPFSLSLFLSPPLFWIQRPARYHFGNTRSEMEHSK